MTTVNRLCVVYVFSGHIYHRVHVFGLVETVPKTYQTQREENFSDRVETMVHANPICPKVCAER